MDDGGDVGLPLTTYRMSTPTDSNSVYVQMMVKRVDWQTFILATLSSRIIPQHGPWGKHRSEKVLSYKRGWALGL